MSQNEAVSLNYKHGDLLNAIQTSLSELGKTIESVSIDDLAAVDEFHIGGRVATKYFLDQIKISKQDHMLDVGCGLGGATRYVVTKYNNKVTGIDLSQEYIDTGNTLNKWLKLNKKITLKQSSALSMPFEEGTFDCGYMIHVGMNIEDKTKLFTEIYRVLRPGSWFGIYDVMRNINGDLDYPVPWAMESSHCYIASIDQYKQALDNAGFIFSKENNRREFALNFFKTIESNLEANGASPSLGLHTLMKENTDIKISNMIKNITADYIIPVELIVKKY